MNPTGTERTLGRDVDREREEREDRVEVDRSMLVSKDGRVSMSWWSMKPACSVKWMRQDRRGRLVAANEHRA